MLREQLIENVRDVHLRWDLKRRVEHDPAVTFLDVRKVAIMWAEEVEAAAPRKTRACVAQCEVAPPGALDKVWEELGAQRKIFSEGLASQQQAISQILGQQQQILSAMASSPTPRQRNPPNEGQRAVACYHCHRQGHITFYQARLPSISEHQSLGAFKLNGSTPCQGLGA